MSPESKSHSQNALADEILADARKKAQRAAKRAEREARQILEKAEEQAEADAQEVIETARERADRQARAVLATVDQDIQREQLQAREEQIEAIFQDALDGLRRRKGYDYPKAMAALAAEAIRAMDGDEVVIGFAEGCAGIATDEWLADVKRRAGRDVTLRVAEEPEAIDGGVFVRSADGRLVYDNSFAARLERLRPRLRRHVAEMIYRDKTAESETG
jgi:V/A-type H+-transporting ATPase subunit E